MSYCREGRRAPARRMLSTVVAALLVVAGVTRAASVDLATAPIATIDAVALLPDKATFDLATATIADINAAMDAGALTSERLVQLYLNRIAAYDQQGPKINSIILVNPNALAIARALDQERKAKGRRSLLHGIPIIAKDLLNTADMQTTGGFSVMKGAVPQADANVIARLRAAGAIILAKANMQDWVHPGGCAARARVPRASVLRADAHQIGQRFRSANQAS